MEIPGLLEAVKILILENVEPLGLLEVAKILGLLESVKVPGVLKVMLETLKALETVIVLVGFVAIEVLRLMKAIGEMDIDKVLLALKAVEILVIIEELKVFESIDIVGVKALKTVKPHNAFS